MPTYGYQCNNCGHQFDQFQSITANALRKCGKCGRMKLNRLIGCGAGIIFKGSGFYQTDYRSQSYKKSEKDEKNSAAAKKAETKKDKETKPAKTDKARV